MKPTLCVEGVVIGDYTLQEPIGHGSYSQVFKAVHSLTGETVAVKVIDKSRLSESDRGRLQTECAVQFQLNHPNIVRLLKAIDSDTHFYMVLEYAPCGEFLAFVNEHGKFRESDACELFGFLVDAIEHTHGAGFINRDIKLDNILIKDGRLLISDWGFASSWHKDRRHTESMGSRGYCSPELASGLSYVGPEVDIWSLGVVLYAMIVGRLPFSSLEAVRMGTFYMPEGVSDELRALFSSMLCKSPTHRATISDVKNSAWMRLYPPPATASTIEGV